MHVKLNTLFILVIDIWYSIAVIIAVWHFTYLKELTDIVYNTFL